MRLYELLDVLPYYVTLDIHSNGEDVFFGAVDDVENVDDNREITWMDVTDNKLTIELE